MSLYYVQKLLYDLNRDPAVKQRYRQDFEALVNEYDLDDEERGAILKPDIGLLYVLGVNGQILMHYAALRGYEWDEYLEAMRVGLREHGQPRAGVYKTVGDY